MNALCVCKCRFDSALEKINQPYFICAYPPTDNMCVGARNHTHTHTNANTAHFPSIFNPSENKHNYSYHVSGTDDLTFSPPLELVIFSKHVQYVCAVVQFLSRLLCVRWSKRSENENDNKTRGLFFNCECSRTPKTQTHARAVVWWFISDWGTEHPKTYPQWLCVCMCVVLFDVNVLIARDERKHIEWVATDTLADKALLE